jgi:phospholipid-binding lipoprotein MlaA
MPYIEVDSAPNSFHPTGGLVVDGVGGSIWVNFLVDEIFDWSTSTEDKVKWSLTGLRIINTRSNVEFRYFETGSPFEYELVRYIWMKNRELQIEQ